MVAVGLPKLNMPKKTTMKADTGQKLQTQPKATGAGVRTAITSSVSGSTTGTTAKLSQNTTAGFFGMSLFGVQAQRSNRLISNVKAGYGPGISSLRHSLLDSRRGMFLSTPMPMPRAQASAQDSYMNSYMKMMELQAFTKSIGDLAAGGVALAKVLKSDKTEGKGEVKKQQETQKKGNVENQQQAATPTGSEVTGSNGNISSQLSSATTSKGLTDALTNLQDSIGPLETAISENEELIQAEKSTQSVMTENINIASQELRGLRTDLTTAQSANPKDQNLIDSITTQIANKENEIQKMQTTLDESKKTQENLENENGKFQEEIADKKNEYLKYNDKLITVTAQETTKLQKLQSELSELSEKFKEAKDGKKAEISTKYTAKAKEFNDILKNSTVEGFQEVGLSLVSN